VPGNGWNLLSVKIVLAPEKELSSWGIFEKHRVLYLKNAVSHTKLMFWFCLVELCVVTTKKLLVLSIILKTESALCVDFLYNYEVPYKSSVWETGTEKVDVKS
jgi:hypothetical protein